MSNDQIEVVFTANLKVPAMFEKEEWSQDYAMRMLDSIARTAKFDIVSIDEITFIKEKK